MTQLHATFKAMVDDRVLTARQVQDVKDMHITMLEYFLCAALHHRRSSSVSLACYDSPNPRPCDPFGPHRCAFHHSLHTSGGGAAVNDMFAKYDKDGSGQLDEAEFYMSRERWPRTHQQPQQRPPPPLAPIFPTV